MAKANYTIRVYNRSNVLLYVLSQVQSARYRLAENEVGDFDVTIPWTDLAVTKALSPPNLVEFWRDGSFVFGGMIRKQEARQDGRVPFYTVSGPSYMQWLVDCKMRPSTGTADIAYGADNLDDTMKNIVRTQVADTHYWVGVDADTGSSTVNEAYTATAYETVLETLQAIATRAQDTSFDIVRQNNALVFKTYAPSRGPDKSLGTASPVLFDLQGGNLLNAEWIRDGNNVANALWGGGPGDKAARYVWPATEALLDNESISDWGRIESFIDAGSDNTTAVQKKVAEELKRAAQPQESVSFEVSNFGRYTFGVHFDFGTKVTVMWAPFFEFTDTIRGLEVTLEQGAGVAKVDINVGDTVTGDASTRASIVLGKFMRQIRRAISVQTRH